MTAGLHWDSSAHCFLIDGVPCAFETRNRHDFDASMVDFSTVSLQSVRAALAAWFSAGQGPPAGWIQRSGSGAVILADVSLTNASTPSWSVDKTAWLTVPAEGDFEFGFSVTLARPELRTVIESILSIIAFKNNVKLSEATGFSDGSVAQDQKLPADSWEIEVSVSSGEVTFSRLEQIRIQVLDALSAPKFTNMSPRMIAETIKRAGTDWLLGQEESGWLEAKSSAYELGSNDKNAWRVELAQDVARFANCDTGGILIIGIRCEKVDGVEVLRRLSPLSPSGQRLRSYHEVLDARIYPAIVGLTVERWETGKGELVWIVVPPQADDNKPYLVQGAVIDGKYEGAMISIVRRRGENSIPISAREIHSMLVAGRRVLHGRN